MANRPGRTHSSVIVQVDLDVTLDDSTERAHKVIDLAGVGATNGIGNTNTVDTDLVNGLVDGEEINEV